MRTLAILAVVILVAVFAVPAFSAEAKAAKGTVTKITPIGEAVEISVTDDMARETIYKLLKETKVTKAGKVISVKDILVKDVVTINKKGEVVESVDIEAISEGVALTTRSGAPVTTKTGEPVTTK